MRNTLLRQICASAPSRPAPSGQGTRLTAEARWHIRPSPPLCRSCARAYASAATSRQGTRSSMIDKKTLLDPAFIREHKAASSEERQGATQDLPYLVKVGDTLWDGCYEIVEELERSQRSAAWLARDFRHNDFVEVRIYKSERENQRAAKANTHETAYWTEPAEEEDDDLTSAQDYNGVYYPRNYQFPSINRRKTMARELDGVRLLPVQQPPAEAEQRNPQNSDDEDAKWSIQPTLGTLRRLSASGTRSLPLLLDDFVVQGSQGSHQCTVSETAILNLAQVKDRCDQGLLPLPTARVLAATLVSAVALLHKANIVHGDLQLCHVKLRAPQDYSLSAEDVSILCREPGEASALASASLGLKSSGGASSSSQLGASVGAQNVFLGGLGNSYDPSDGPRFSSSLPITYQPPEAQFMGEYLSSPADIWSLGCLLWIIVGNRPLFHLATESSDELLDDQVNLLGRLPPFWWNRWEANNQYWKVGEDGELQPVHSEARKTWEARFSEAIGSPRQGSGLAEMDKDEEQAFLELVKGMMKLRPGQRISAYDVVRSRWMREYCLPLLEGAQ